MSKVHDTTIETVPAEDGYGVRYVVSCPAGCDLGRSASQSTLGQAQGRAQSHERAMKVASEGQDRESYTDMQDRESYEVSR